MEVTRVRHTRPSTSSMRAAARMVLPAFVVSLPISRSVSTVMLTEVAVSTVPRNRPCSTRGPPLLSSPPVKAYISTVPSPRGTSTPHSATRKPDLPLAFRS